MFGDNMFEEDLKFREELEKILKDIEAFCKSTVRLVQINPVSQLRKDVAYTCSRLIPEIIEMTRILAMRNSELAATNIFLLQRCDNYKELAEERIEKQTEKDEQE